MQAQKIFKNTILASISISLVACSATHTAIKKRELDVQTKMSDTIFLTPASKDRKIVFIDIKNTSDMQQLKISDKVSEAISSKGYKVTGDPNKANYWIQANILQVGKANLREANDALNNGYGTALSGAFTGGMVGALGGNDSDSVIAGGLLGAGIATISDALVKDISYSIVTDVQISERVRDSEVITETENLRAKQGARGNINYKSSSKTNWKRYQTRILSTANKLNLKFKDAEPELIAGLTNSLSGLL